MADDAKTAEGKKWAQDGCDEGQVNGTVMMIAMIVGIAMIIDLLNVGDFDGNIGLTAVLMVMGTRWL